MDDLSVFWVMTVRLVTASKLSSYLWEQACRGGSRTSAPAVLQGANDQHGRAVPPALACLPLAVAEAARETDRSVQLRSSLCQSDSQSPELNAREVELL